LTHEKGHFRFQCVLCLFQEPDEEYGSVDFELVCDNIATIRSLIATQETEIENAVKNKKVSYSRLNEYYHYRVFQKSMSLYAKPRISGCTKENKTKEIYRSKEKSKPFATMVMSNQCYDRIFSCKTQILWYR